MSVDQAGEQDLVGAEPHDSLGAEGLVVRRDRHDPAASYADARSHLCRGTVTRIGNDGPRCADDEIEAGHGPTLPRGGRPRPAQSAPMLPPDNHVHTQFSWDTGTRSSMVRACEQAVAAGLPAVAFTEHVDFTDWGAGDHPTNEIPEARDRGSIRPLDVEGYVAAVRECRKRFTGLRILSGVETGEPHLFPGSLVRLLGQAGFDRVLGSLHSLQRHGLLVGVGWFFSGGTAYDVVRDYCAELIRMIETSDVFEVLAHFDFPRRYWPSSAGPYEEAVVEEEHRSVFRALAGSGRVLEINTASPLASAAAMRWWYDAGGAAVSFGSDAHRPHRVGDRFGLAVDVVEAAGFRPGRDRFDYWRR